MTKDQPVEHLFQEITCDSTQQQKQQQQPKKKQKPFHVVLVDIEKAAEDRIIHCVEKPLEEDGEDVAFVALSYRWGELEETTLDTNLGYLASVTSFDLYDFYHLCEMMSKESDLKNIKYVWVDAICVDQTNYDRRKATIYQMSNIYEKATYILAVPDLHRQHLRNISCANYNIIQNLEENVDYMYHLIQGNSDQLMTLDQLFLDTINLPKDPKLRQWLTNYTDLFADGFTKTKIIDSRYDYMKILDHIYEIHQEAGAHNLHHQNVEDSTNHFLGNWLTRIKRKLIAAITTTTATAGENDTSKERHRHCHQVTCPLIPFQGAKLLMTTAQRRELETSWKQLIVERSLHIHEGMEFLTDLIKDWSSRVWVISEFHIAKKKNNLKYWFIGLNPPSEEPTTVTFFKFDFDNPRFLSAIKNIDTIFYDDIATSAPGYLNFHAVMNTQLNTQTFFEKMLKSKASKHEDRFFAILPQTNYKDKIYQIGDCNLNSMTAVKLKLFEIMDTKDKLDLLFLVGTSRMEYKFDTLPTFITPTIYWNDPFRAYGLTQFPYNFDFLDNNQSTITLHQEKNSSRQHYLQLTPKEYYVHHKLVHHFISNNKHARKTKLFDYLPLDDNCSLILDIISISLFNESAIVDDAPLEMINHRINLIGSFEKNKWLLCKNPLRFNKDNWDYHANEDHCIIFNIY
ncbi:unnamed protein product [Absidia cylindrospora]